MQTLDSNLALLYLYEHLELFSVRKTPLGWGQHLAVLQPQLQNRHQHSIGFLGFSTYCLSILPFVLRHFHFELQTLLSPATVLVPCDTISLL
jgi:hypothetical protein